MEVTKYILVYTDEIVAGEGCYREGKKGGGTKLCNSASFGETSRFNEGCKR